MPAPDNMPNDSVKRLLSENLSMYLQPSAGAAETAAPAAPQDAAPAWLVSRAYKLSIASLDQAQKDVLGAAQAVGWRYLVYRDGRPAACIETADGEKGPEFANISEGPQAAQIAYELTWLASTGQVPADVELLEVPSLSVSALWLRGGDGTDDDWLIPLTPSPRELRPRSHTRLTGAEFSQRVRALARERRGMKLNVTGGFETKDGKIVFPDIGSSTGEQP